MPDTDDTESFKAELREPLEHYQLTEQLSNTIQSGLHRKGLPSETFTKIDKKKKKKGCQPQVIKRKGYNSFLCKCPQDQQMAVHFHRSQMPTTFQKCWYKIVPVGSSHNDSVAASSVFLKLLSPSAQSWLKKKFT